MRTKIKHISKKDLGKEIKINGWLRTVRTQKTFSFLSINDGSSLSCFQAIADEQTENYQDLQPNLQTGASVCITGTIVESPGKEQSVEMKATKIKLVGKCDPENYPLQKKRHSLEFLRTIAHLRPRTNTFGAVTRVRNALAMATHKFFQDKGFLYIHTPIITASDCEGAGQMFKVTTLDYDDQIKNPKNKIDYSQDFFGKQTYLTVSGQLNVENFACALSDVYTFGPTFRAENSNTSRHLAEFWMIEPEMAFADINDDMDCTEQYLKFCLQHVMKNCSEDMEFFNKFYDKTLLQKLQLIIEAPFQRVTYTDAMSLLQKSNQKFEYSATWGTDLQTEHERFLVEKHFKKPVIVTNYPKSIKPFYMHVNDDGKTVAAMDVLVAGVGEIIGGSQRESRLEILESRMDEQKLDKQEYWWYLDLRKYGTIPHAGFGLGFERLVQFATSMENIRDVIPFPRYPKHISF
jgi:asparaginyl-tRNA synthetase